MIGRSACWCIVTVTSVIASQQTEGRDVLLAYAVESADAVVVGRLVEFLAGTFWEPERREGTLLVQHVVKGNVEPGRLQLSFSDGWRDYSLQAIVRRSWWLILASIAVVFPSAIRPWRRPKRPTRRSLVLYHLPAAILMTTIWLLLVPLFRCGHGRTSVRRMLETDMIWLLSRKKGDRGCWGGGPRSGQAFATYGSEYLTVERDFAQRNGLSSQTVAALDRLLRLRLELPSD